jgi:Tfp pilus assembly protein FimT
VVVLALVGILAVVGIPNLIRAKVRAEMLGQAKMLRQALSVARINAIKGQVPVVMSFEAVGNTGGMLTAFVDDDGNETLGGGERVVGSWRFRSTFRVTQSADVNLRFHMLGGQASRRGVVFLPSGSAIVNQSGAVGTGRAAAEITDIKNNRVRIMVNAGAGTVQEEMWDPYNSEWSDKLVFWSY